MEVAEIIEAVDIVEYISQYTELSEKNGEWWGLSPFNNEKTASFSVRKETGQYYDFSAGVGGNIIDFIMRHDDVDLSHAVKTLKAYAHIKDNEKNGSYVSFSALKIAKKYRQQQKKVNECTAKILPENYMERYEFRKDKLKVWADEGIQYDIMYKWGVRYDGVDNRIVYPIRDLEGNIFCVSGRTLDPLYKEHGLRKYTYTSSIGSLPTIYGAWENRNSIREAGEIILFEGCKSVLKVEGYGFGNAGALLTSHLSPRQLAYLIKIASFDRTRIVFALDEDVDVTKDDNIKRLCSYARVEYLHDQYGILKEKDSPVDQGEEKFRVLYENRIKLN